MIGIPGQSYNDLVSDILLCAQLDLDMIGVGPFLPHPQTPLGTATATTTTAFTTESTEDTEAEEDIQTATAKARITREKPQTEGEFPNPKSAHTGLADSKIRPYGSRRLENPKSSQVPKTELMTYKTLALVRLSCPRANIPSTTALATLNRESGRELGLQRGANIVMPNLTPSQYRALYEIYPAKACIYETADACHACLTRRLKSIGRDIGRGRGDSAAKHYRKQATPCAQWQK